MKPPNIFVPGPSQLYFTVRDHLRNAFRDGIPSLSHRSAEFEKIFLRTTNGLRKLLGIPSNLHIIFAASATEIWERILQNCVEEHSFHLINGEFSKRFYDAAVQLGKKPGQVTVDAGRGFDAKPNTDRSELIVITHNETSTGVSLPVEFVHQFRDTNHEALIAVDAVSSLPYPEFDYSKIDTIFFSVQKGFGLPAGLGVWIVNDRCVSKADNILRKGVSIGSYHSLPTLIAYAKRNQTPETPNVLGIYLLGCVVNDMLQRGVATIRRETEYKAALLYHALKKHKSLKPFVLEEEFQSKTVIVANCGDSKDSLAGLLKSKGMVPGEGYGPFKNQHLRFANFPAHSREQFEKLADLIDEFNG